MNIVEIFTTEISVQAKSVSFFDINLIYVRRKSIDFIKSFDLHYVL